VSCRSYCDESPIGWTMVTTERLVVHRPRTKLPGKQRRRWTGADNVTCLAEPTWIFHRDDGRVPLNSTFAVMRRPVPRGQCR